MIQTTSHLPEDRLRFLEAFFGPGNEIAWRQVVSGEGRWGERVRPWVEDLRASDRPVLLPRVLPGGRVEWYALAFNARQARALRDDLTAFLGPTYSTFNGLPADLAPHDPVDAAVSRLVGPLAYRFAPAGPRGADSLWPVLSLMRSLWRQRPARVAASPIPVARLLRNFEMALQAADWAAAGAALEQLRLRGGVSLSNLRHLKVRRLVARGQWDTTLSLPDLPLVLADRRPAAVNDGLLAAVYHTHLLSFEAANDPVGAVDHFRAAVQGPYGALLRSRGPLRTPHVLKMFMLLAVAESNRPRAESILDAAQHGAVEWDLEALRAEPAQVRRFVDGMAADRGEAATATLRNAVPHLLAWYPERKNWSALVAVLYRHVETNFAR